MIEIELKAYFFPSERSAVQNIQELIENRSKKKFCSEQIVDSFFDKKKELKEKNYELRLRKQGKNYYVTFKGEIDKKGGYKAREELETEIQDGEVIATILEKMGYRKIRELKKERRTLRYNNCSITIDIFKKIGFIIEVEGEPKKIEETISFFSLDRSRFKAQTYFDILNIYKSKTR